MLLQTIVAHNKQTFCIRSLKQGDEISLKEFNESLGIETRSMFLPHSYDEKTLKKVVERSEKGLDVTLGVFEENESAKKMVGYAFLWHAKQRIPLLGIGVTDTLKRQGLGKQLMCILEEQARLNCTYCESISIIT